MATFLLYESASGYALFEAGDMDEIGQTQEAVQDTITCVRRPAFCHQGEIAPALGVSRAARVDRTRARVVVAPRVGRIGRETATANGTDARATIRATRTRPASPPKTVRLRRRCPGGGRRFFPENSPTLPL